MFSGTSSSVIAPRIQRHRAAPRTPSRAPPPTRLRRASASSSATRHRRHGREQRVVARVEALELAIEDRRAGEMELDAGELGPRQHRVHAVEHAALRPARLRADLASRAASRSAPWCAPSASTRPSRAIGSARACASSSAGGGAAARSSGKQRRGVGPEGTEGDVVGRVEARHVLDAVDLAAAASVSARIARGPRAPSRSGCSKAITSSSSLPKAAR